MHKAKTQKQLKHKLKKDMIELSKLEDPNEKRKFKRKLPKLFYSAL